MKKEYNMKTKTSICHRTFAFAYVLLLAVIFCGCEPAMPQNNTKDTYDIGQYKIVEIDSCEYIVSDVYEGYDICHKGNCKFCAERRKK